MFHRKKGLRRAQKFVMSSEYMTVICKFKEEQTYLYFISICIGNGRCCSCINGKIQEVNEINRLVTVDSKITSAKLHSVYSFMHACCFAFYNTTVNTTENLLNIDGVF